MRLICKPSRLQNNLRSAVILQTTSPLVLDICCICSSYIISQMQMPVKCTSYEISVKTGTIPLTSDSIYGKITIICSYPLRREVLR